MASPQLYCREVFRGPDPVRGLSVTEKSGTTDVVRGLTRRQLEVLTLMAEGRSNAGIAAQLHLSEKAVVQHTSRIYELLELSVASDDHRRVLAVIRFLASVNAADRVD